MSPVSRRRWGSSIVGFGSYHYRYASGQEGDARSSASRLARRRSLLYTSAGDHCACRPLGRAALHKVGKGCVYFEASRRCRRAGSDRRDRGRGVHGHSTRPADATVRRRPFAVLLGGLHDLNVVSVRIAKGRHRREAMVERWCRRNTVVGQPTVHSSTSAGGTRSLDFALRSRVLRASHPRRVDREVKAADLAAVVQ